MKEINWESVAEEYQLTPKQLQEQIFTTACVMGDMELDKTTEYATPVELQFTCSQQKYKLELTVRRIYKNDN